MRASEREVLDSVPKQLLIGGRVARRRGRRQARRRGPGDRASSWSRSPTPSPEDAKAALSAAAEAQAEWAQSAPRDRGEILRAAYEKIVARADELALLMTLEMGKSVAESKAEISYAAEFFRWFSEEAVRIHGRYMVNTTGKGRILTMRQPVGPCVFVTPWNFPTAMGTRKIAPAVAAGCTMVVKPAQQTPLSMLALAQILQESGLPGGVLNVITAKRSGAVDRTAAEGPAHAQAVVHRLDRGRPRADRTVGRADPAHRRWSSAATRRSSCSRTPTSTRRSRARCWRRCATSARRARRPTASTSTSRWPRSSRSGWPSGWASSRSGAAPSPDVDVGPLIDGTQREKVQELVDRRGRPRREGARAAGTPATVPATSTSRPCWPGSPRTRA